MKHSQNNKQEYPIVRYLSILLAVALLFSGVTFARYALSRNESVNTGIAKYDASYTIDGVNSVAFGNSSYWMDIAGAWYEQGSARTVRVKMQNNSDVNVRAKTLHMEGPADFWENIALQLMTAKDDGTAENIITTQYVLADFLRVREKNPEEHNFKYGDYINWNSNSGANGAQDGVFDTGFSDGFGQRYELGQRDNVEETLQISGSITASEDVFEGSVTAVRQSASYTNPDQTGTPLIDDEALTITITASMKTVEYSVGFARKQENNLSMPAFYLDCMKTVPYYSIDITLPETDHFNMTAENGSTSLIAFLTWTNSDLSQELETQLEDVGQENFSVPETFRGATVIGYHFNYNDVPTTEGETTTVRMNKALKTWTVEEDGTIDTTPVDEITWEHISTISKGDGVYAHPLTPQGNNYVCSGKNPVTIEAGVLGNSPYDGSITGEFDTTMVNDIEGCFASEKGYAVSFGVYFEQSSELPPSDTTP